MTARADAAPRDPPVPRVSVLLLLGGVAHLVVILLTRSAPVRYLDLTLPSVLGYLMAATPLLLAAAILAGRDRWPAGRRWLTAAVVAYALVAALDVLGWIWITIAPPFSAADPNPPLARLRSVLWLCASLAAPLLAAAGLWRAGRAAAPSGARAVLGWLAAGLAAIAIGLPAAAIVGSFDDLGRLGAFVRDDPVLVGMLVLALLVPAATVLLGAAALRAMPRRYLLPEALVALGAIAAGLGSALALSIPTVVGDRLGSEQIGTVVIWSNAVALLGTMTVAIGFFIARISAPGER